MDKHYVCTGGCKGVSANTGTCQADTCSKHNQDLMECMCADGTHNDFKSCESCGKMCGGTCQASYN